MVKHTFRFFGSVSLYIKVSPFYILLPLLFLSMACSKEEVSREVIVPEEVQPYIDRFIAEAAQRDHFIELTNFGLDITFEQGLEDSLAAFCNNGRIIINQKFWDTRSDITREAMIFHELGHCILHREHHNAILANDEWSSLMRGDPVPVGRSTSINFNGIRRQYYIDELFDVHTPEPSWVNLREDYELPLDSRDTFLHLSNAGGFTHGLQIPDSVDFEIEVLIDRQNSTSPMGLTVGSIQIQDGLVIHYNADKTFVINAGLTDQGVIYQVSNFGLLADDVNLISLRRRGDRYYIFVNKSFVYWVDVKLPFVNRFNVLATYLDPPIFREILVYRL
jgi:predicted SprT family Zn-dependent metalloprotease